VTPVRIVLDTSAVCEYAAGSINVGEVIAEVADESARFAVPLVCLTEAARQVSAESLSAPYVLEAHKHGTIVAEELIAGGFWLLELKSLGRLRQRAAELAVRAESPPYIDI
jgi:hypothetical protein